MKDKKKKLANCLNKHFVGIGIGIVTAVMALTAAKGVSGQEVAFDPGGIDTSFSSVFSEMPDKTGYDLSGEGEDSEEINHNSDSEQEEEKNEEEEKENNQEEETLGLDSTEPLQNPDSEQVILPDELTENIEPSDTIDAALTPGLNEEGNTAEGGAGKSDGAENSSSSGGSGGGGSRKDPPSKDEEEKPGEDEDKPPVDGEEKPGEPENGNQPGNGGQPEEGQQPEAPKEDEPPVEEEKPSPAPDENKFSVVIGGEKKEFDSEDDALAWVADNGGKNENGQYFEGFVKDENGDMVPSYTDKDNFNTGSGSGGDVAYGYDGESSVFVIPEGVTRVDLSVVANDKVKTIVIPKTVVQIAAGGGNEFTALEKFVVSADNPNYLSVDGVLYRHTDTGEIQLHTVPARKKEIQKWPEQLTVIKENTFYGLVLDKVELPDSVTVIETSAFSESSVGIIVLPENVKTIGSTAFAFAFPEQGQEAAWHRIVVKSRKPPELAGAAFAWMDYNLEQKLGDPTTEILVPDSADDQVYEDYLMTWGMALAKRYGGEMALRILKTENGAQARYEYFEENGKSGYRRTDQGRPPFLSDSQGIYRMDEAGNLVLVRCTSSASLIDLSGSEIMSIDQGAFDGCTSLEAIYLPETLENMPEDGFAKNEKLKVIVSYALKPPVTELDVSADCAVFVKPDVLEEYESAWGAQVRKVVGTSETYTYRSPGLVLDQENTRLLDVAADIAGNLIIPRQIASIYKGAAEGNRALTQVTVQAAGTEGGERAFAGCVNLTAVTWATSAPVPDSCFEGCTSLKTFSASGSGHNLTSIGRRAFYGCASLETVLWYSYSSGGQNYYYYYFLEHIGEEAFWGCTSMKYAYIHDSVNDVGAGAFKESGLADMHWYTSLPVPESCFAGCVSLKTVGWGNGRTTGLEDEAFYGCTGLETFLVPSAVTYIGQSVFDGREGKELILSFLSQTPPSWSGPDFLDGFVIYVPDSREDGDSIYRSYREAWENWLGECPEEILKTKDGAHERALHDLEPEEYVLGEELILEIIDPETESAPDASLGEEDTEEGDAEPGEEDFEEDDTDSEEEDSEEDTDRGEGDLDEKDFEEEDTDLKEEDSKEDADSGKADSEEEDTDPGETDLEEEDTDSEETDSEKEDIDSGEADSEKENIDSGEADPERENIDSGEADSEKEDTDSGKEDFEEEDSRVEAEDSEKEDSESEKEPGKEEFGSEEEELDSNYSDKGNQEEMSSEEKIGNDH